MNLYIGIDLGTSAAKLLLMDELGEIKNVISKEYPLEFPKPGWSQQNPEDWRKAILEGIPELLTGLAIYVSVPLIYSVLDLLERLLGGVS